MCAKILCLLFVCYWNLDCYKTASLNKKHQKLKKIICVRNVSQLLWESSPFSPAERIIVRIVRRCCFYAYELTICTPGELVYGPYWWLCSIVTRLMLGEKTLCAHNFDGGISRFYCVPFRINHVLWVENYFAGKTMLRSILSLKYFHYLWSSIAAALFIRLECDWGRFIGLGKASRVTSKNSSYSQSDLYHSMLFLSAGYFGRLKLITSV